MSRESKIITALEFDTQKTISHYESFGWELLSINGKQITMSRETQNPVYTDLVKHQSRYEDAMEKYRALRSPTPPVKPNRFSFGTWFITLILCILPCVAYTTYKIVKHRKYKAAMENYTASMVEYNQQRAALLKQMEDIALESRVIFFSKQDQ